MTGAGLSVDGLTRAGAELADEVGFERVTLTALAQRFDVRVPSLYSHVKNSQDLKTRIALLSLGELADRASDAVAGRAGKDALLALANVYRDYANEHPGRYAATQMRLDPSTAAASAGTRHTQTTKAILRGYDIPASEHPHAVRLLGSVFHGYVSLEMGGSFSHSAPDTDETWSRTLDALDTLLHHWPTS